jgi:hypothetical protein
MPVASEANAGAKPTANAQQHTDSAESLLVNMLHPKVRT